MAKIPASALTRIHALAMKIMIALNVRRAFAVISSALVIASALSCSSPTGPTNRNPESAQLIFTDIPRFWTAFDAMSGASDTLPLRQQYLNGGSVGLTDMTNRRWKNAANLATMIWPVREYYKSVRSATLQLATNAEPSVRSAFRGMSERYPDAVFPDVYFVVGGLSTGGTVGDHGLLIGTEMFSAGDGARRDVLNAWQQSVVRGPELIDAIVAHELTHFQQVSNSSTLLNQSIREGSADFVAELLTGKNFNAHLRTYGLANETALWNEFKLAMNGTDISRWLYNGGAATLPDGRPADLGYFIGYRIAEAYWLRTTDKVSAFRSILRFTDPTAFLAASGYAPH